MGRVDPISDISQSKLAVDPLLWIGEIQVINSNAGGAFMGELPKFGPTFGYNISDIELRGIYHAQAFCKGFSALILVS